jgi:predicted site-specific integrase-resolvase
MKLSQWATTRGISYKAARHWFKSGNLPPGVKVKQMSNGTVIVTEFAHPAMAVLGLAVGLNARMSPSDRKNDLESQLGRLVAHANGQGWMVTRSVAGRAGKPHRQRLKVFCQE